MADLQSVSITWDEKDRPVVTVQYEGTGDVDSESSPQEWLEVLADRLTDKSAKYLRGLIEMNISRGHVSFVDLAAHLNVDKKEVDGWNRNLGRSVKAVVREHGFLRPDEEDGTAQIFDLEWNNPQNMWLYAVPEKFRPALVDALDER
jgi:hypothetical protein